VEFQGAARCGCDVTSLYPQTSRQNRRKALQQILQSLLQMMFAARAAKTAGVNRKSYVIQTPLTLILAPADHIRWLSDEPDPHDLLRPYPAEPMRMWPISTRVNKPENDDPSILQPIELSAA
jgi:type II secretory pathway pseudopilin PulG